MTDLRYHDKEHTHANPYRIARLRGFWYGFSVGAALVGLLWRLFR